MRKTRIIAVILAFATIVTVLSILASCGGKKEPEFTVPTVPVVTQSEKSETSNSYSNTESGSGETSSANTESAGTETTGSNASVAVDFSTIPLPGENGYSDHIRYVTSQYIREDGKTVSRLETVYDEGFEDYPLDRLNESYYAMAYRLKAEHAEELASEPMIANYVETAWQRAQGYRPVMFDTVSTGKMIFPLPVSESYPTATFENKVYALLKFVDSYFQLYSSTKVMPDKTVVFALERTEQYYEAIRDFSVFFISFCGNMRYSSLNSIFSSYENNLNNAVASQNSNISRHILDLAEELQLNSTFSSHTEYDEEKMKTKVTLDGDGFDYFLAQSGTFDAYSGEPKHLFCAPGEFWVDAAASSTYYSIQKRNESGFSPIKKYTVYALSNEYLLPERAANIQNASLKMAVESFLGKTDPTVKDLSAIVGIEWTEDTITLTDRRGNSKSYPSNGVCKVETTFDDFVSLSTFSIDASELSGELFTRNCFLSLETLTVIGSRAECLDLSTVPMLKHLVIHDCPELHNIDMGDGIRFIYHFEFSGKKNVYIRSLDFLSGLIYFWYFDISALSIDSIGGFHGQGFGNIGDLKLVLGDIYDIEFFHYCFNIWDINIYGEAPSDEEILAKIYEDKEHTAALAGVKQNFGKNFSIKRY